MSRRCLVVLLVACLGAVPAVAQPLSAPPGTVTGQGFVDVKQPPEVLRVQIELLAKGKDLKDALARLKERREAARSRLAALGAVQEGVVFGEPALNAEKTDRQKQLEGLVAARLRVGGGKPATQAKLAPPTMVSSWLQFEVPLKAADAEELLLVSQRLQDRIRAADLSGLKEVEKLSPQEEEIAEEAKLAEATGQDGAPTRGEPAFSFVRKISEQELSRALAEAFQKARQEAARLAQAAGAEMGRLHHLENQLAAGSPEGTPQFYFDGRRQYAVPVPHGLPAAAGPEAVGAQPGQVSYRVMVTAAFLLKDAQGAGR